MAGFSAPTSAAPPPPPPTPTPGLLAALPLDSEEEDHEDHHNDLLDDIVVAIVFVDVIHVMDVGRAIVMSLLDATSVIHAPPVPARLPFAVIVVSSSCDGSTDKMDEKG